MCMFYHFATVRIRLRGRVGVARARGRRGTGSDVNRYPASLLESCLYPHVDKSTK